MGYGIFCCLPVFPLAGSLSAPTLEGIRPSVMVSPNHGENKEGAVTAKPHFPPDAAEEHTKITLSLMLQQS